MKQHETQHGSKNHEVPVMRRNFDPMALATLVGVVVVLMISYSSMRDIDRLDRSLGERIAKLEAQVAQSGRAQPATVQRGPDPARTYPIKITSDTPSRGPASAPVTIAEFSDFQ